MVDFKIRTKRHEPFKNFKFRVMFDSRYVAGISKVSALKQTVETITHREGGDPNIQYVSPTLTKFDPVTLERGITFDEEFERWARTVFDYNEVHQPSLLNFRKKLSIELLDEQGVVVKLYHVHDCWVSEYEMLPELDANSGAFAIERLVLQNGGVEMANPAETQET